MVESFDEHVERTLNGVAERVVAEVQNELLKETDTDRDVYSLRIQYLNPLTGDNRTALTGCFYQKVAAERVRARLLADRNDLLFPILLRAYPNACPMHWFAVGIRVVRLAEIPF